LHLAPLTSLKFTQTPECVEFFTDSNGIEHLIVAVRDSYQLVYVSCIEPHDQRLISMNEADWDTHASFSALQLALSPDEKILAIANDKNAIILIDMLTDQRLQVLVGHNCGEYGKPKLAWDLSGGYLYCNSDGEHGVYVYSLFKGKVVEVLSGHAGLVKDIKSHPHKRSIVTASFDHSVILWHRNQS
jgi:WD40 repeat protein